MQSLGVRFRLMRKKKSARPVAGRLGVTYCASLMAACAAARRAMGTRKGEQDT